MTETTAARRAAITAIVLGAAAAFPSASRAADLPVKARPVPATPAGGFYVWVDPSYQSIALPTYSLGFHRAPGAPPLTDQGPVQSFDPRATGYGIAGGIGYVVPPGAVFAFGQHARFELGVSYVKATSGQNDSVAPSAMPNNRAAVPMVSGAMAPTTLECFTLAPAGFIACSFGSSLNTDYQSWQVNGRAATDFRMGAVTLSPSLALFGGQTRNNQDLAQTLTQQTLAVATFSTTTYNASTSLQWTDFGARLGLDAILDVTPALALGVGGSVGVASRSVSLSGNDRWVTTIGFPSATSAVSTSANATPFLANAEASVIFKATPSTAVRGFGGLNYDSRVPGVSTPGWAGSATAPTSTTAAGINYSALTSWYAGGAIVVAFGR